MFEFLRLRKPNKNKDEKSRITLNKYATTKAAKCALKTW